jgi:hypothetical protein
MQHNLLDGLQRLLGMDKDVKLVQFVTITINGVKHLYIGPVIQELFEREGPLDIQDITFGEVVEASQALKLLQGGYLEGEDIN